MQIGDQPTNDPAYDTPALQTTLFPLPRSHPLPIREFLTTDQPRNRLAQQGASALSNAELLAVITGVPCLETAQRLLIAAGGLRGLQSLSTVELQDLVAGISVGRATQLKAAIELGTRVARGDQRERRQVLREHVQIVTCGQMVVTNVSFRRSMPCAMYACQMHRHN
jgi:hypothetical protein